MSDPSDEDEIQKFFTPVLKAVLESLGITSGVPEIYKMIYPTERPAKLQRLEEYQSGTQFFVLIPLTSGDRELEAHIKFLLDEKGAMRLQSSNLVSGDYLPTEKPEDADEHSLKPWVKLLLPIAVSSILRLLLDQSKVTHDLPSALPIIIDNLRKFVSGVADTLEKLFGK